MAFYEACSSQSPAEMQRHDENQDGGPAEVKKAAFWRSFPVFSRKTYRRRQIKLCLDWIAFWGFNVGRQNSAGRNYDIMQNFSPQYIIEQYFDLVPCVCEILQPFFIGFRLLIRHDYDFRDILRPKPFHENQFHVVKISNWQTEL